MREFNTSGPCDPKLHYTVPRPEIVARGLDQIDKGRFFTIFAPRQAGKTTCFKMMLEALEGRDEYVGTWISIEDLRSAPPDVFWRKMSLRLAREFEIIRPEFEAPEMGSTWDIEELAVALRRHGVRRWVLIIDEFEGAPPDLLGDLMHHFRQLYHKRATHALHSLVLVGVGNTTEADQDSLSNILDEVQIDHFSRSEVCDLVRQYEDESGQSFDEDVIRQIYKNTLVSCHACNVV